MIEAVLAGLFGLLIGSFLNVCIYRLPRDLSVVRPRSFCPACEHRIAWYDNIPLLSFFLLRGKCRYCSEPIGWRYPAVELATGALFFCGVYALGPDLEALRFCLFSACIVTLVFADLEERILPDEFTIGGMAAGIALAAFVPIHGSIWQVIFSGTRYGRWISVFESAFAAVFSALALWCVGVVYQKVRHREGLGFGDVKMVAMIGAFLGLQGVLLTLIIGSAFGAVTGLIYIFATGKDASTYELPLGSFLGMAALAVAFYGEVVAAWWLRLGM